MLLPSLVILVVMLTLSFVTLLAFSKTASSGQFENPQEAARSIFDADEPIGKPTDPLLQNLPDEADPKI
jgi:cbb3-type cytochrome oxidase maturation protein